MSGVPVVIVPKGGIPVREVAENAPVMTVADNGFGTPITLSPLGAPFIVEGGTPPADIWSPFTITAGNNVFGWGYAKEPIVSAPIGSISNEPYSGAQLVGFFEAPDDSQVIVSFLGDVVDELEGYSFQINGTILPVVTPASYNPVSGLTNLFIGAYYMIDGQTYNVERVSAEFDPLAFFEGTAYAGRLYDYKKSEMFTDAGVTPAAIGQSVYRIQDRTGGQNSDQTTSSLQGLLRADGIEIDGLDDFYPTDFAMAGNMFTVVAAATLDAAAPIPAMLAAGAASGTDRLMLYADTATGRPRIAIGEAAADLSSESLLGGYHSLAYTRSSSTSGARYLDGVQVSSGAVSARYGSTPMYIGARNLAGVANAFLKGKIRGFLVINRVLTATEIANIHAYWSA